MLFVAAMLGNRVVPVQVDKHPRRLEPFGEPVYRGRDDIFLAVPVQEDLFAKAGVPEARNHLRENCGERFLVERDRARHSEMMIGMRAIPERLRDGAAGLFRHGLGHARDEESVLAVAGVRAVRLGAPDGDDYQIALVEPFLDVFHRHVLKINAVGRVHVSTLRRYLPLAHFCLLVILALAVFGKAPSVCQAMIHLPARS